MKKTTISPKTQKRKKTEKQLSFKLITTVKDAREYFSQYKSSTEITPEIWQNFANFIANRGVK